jgi:uncharacterized Tic20 family protein
MKTTTEKNLATFTHLSTLSQYCIPFGNYIFPLLIWSTNKDKSEFIDTNGKRVLNFQLSIFLYSLVLALIAIPIFLINLLKTISLNAFTNNIDYFFDPLNFQKISGIIIIASIAIFFFLALKIAEFILIIYASVKTSNGEDFSYPLSIPFIK